MPKAKPNFRKIAELAGVSVSTVDRVLNHRGGVSDARHQRVVTVARSLDVGRILPQGVRGSLHFDVIRTQDDYGTEYYQRLERALESSARSLKNTIQLHRSIWPSADLSELVTFIRAARHRRHGLLVITRDSPEIRQALAALDPDKVPVVLMNSRISGAEMFPYVGIDHVSAGRTAGWMMGRAIQRPGRVLLVTGATVYTAHRERANGFIEVLCRDFPHLQLEGPHDMGDDPEHARQWVVAHLQGEQPLLGVYNTGSGSAGVVRALESATMSERPFWIGHEATQQHARLIEQGWISLLIDQDPETQAMSALQYLIHRYGEDQAPVRLQTTFHLVTRENLDQHRRDE